MPNCQRSESTTLEWEEVTDANIFPWGHHAFRSNPWSSWTSRFRNRHLHSLRAARPARTREQRSKMIEGEASMLYYWVRSQHIHPVLPSTNLSRASRIILSFSRTTDKNVETGKCLLWRMPRCQDGCQAGCICKGVFLSKNFSGGEIVGLYDRGFNRR